MRILDSEVHPFNPAGIDCCYPMQPRWRYPYVAGPEPKIRTMVAEAVADGRFDDHTDILLDRMNRHGIEKAVIMRGNFVARNADLAALVKKHPDRFVAFTGWDVEGPAGNPPRESPKGLAALEQGFTDYGFLGAGEFDLSRFAPLPPEQAWPRLRHLPQGRGREVGEICTGFGAAVRTAVMTLESADRAAVGREPR